ncbi:hypothetical protein H9645_03560 [Luteimonas sp. Sa2BVA3]|uniref:Uncharacterized protein n=1 Tax=Luteimonas colneyensis TaxID=2762230 RepID=A0ABR8UGE1_9GAMM|nr:hypothetical protein [Luteimonas colneyensis]MBD7987098.1 hypothetical protein [Luteimonas colneyensis]
MTIEHARALFAPELAEDDLKEVVRQIQKLQEGRGFLAAHHEIPRLQGDIWSGLPIVRISADGHAAARPARAMLLSNTCDIAEENARDYRAHVTYVPVVRISAFERMLTNGGLPQDRINSIVQSIRLNESTRVFFVEAGAGLEEDCLAMLDQAFSASADILNAGHCERLAVLSDRGHWALVLKMSVHFCRLREGVVRAAAQ